LIPAFKKPEPEEPVPRGRRDPYADYFPPSVLIVTPTRELAEQISKVGGAILPYTTHKMTTIYGGVSMGPQINKINNGTDIVVATPGRLLDVYERQVLDLSQIKVLILDEADRMLDQGFWPDVKKIIDLLPEERQNLLFSATMSGGVRRVIHSVLRDPVQIQCAKSNSIPTERIKQRLMPVHERQKAELLCKILKEGEYQR
ncbi:hypothetical protein KIPB_012985, partial [Kipferlia bialata]